MAHTHDIGSTYWHVMKVPSGTPVLQIGSSHEIEDPWRVGRCILLTVAGRALVIGRWGPGRTAEQVVQDELDALEPDEDEIAASRSVSIEAIRGQFRPEERPTRRHPLYEVR